MGWDSTGPSQWKGRAEYPAGEGILEPPRPTLLLCLKVQGSTEMHVSCSKRQQRHSVRHKWIGEDGRWIWVDRGGIESSPGEILREKRSARVGIPRLAPRSPATSGSSSTA